MSIASYLQALIRDKATLVANLKKKGISSASSEETFTTLVAKVDEIDQGIDTSDATATASDIISGKTAYASGSKITGTHIDLDTSDATATASDMLDSKTAYVDGSKITGNIPSKAAQTYTPTTTDQQIASGQYLSGNQTIKGDANLVSSNIKAGATIFGVAGDSNVMDTTEPLSTTASASNVQSGMSAYVNGQRIVGECVSMEGTEYTPTTTDQVIQGPKILQGNKTMTIKGDADLTAQNIKAGVNIFDVEGSFTSDGTATSSDMKSGVIAYVNGEKVTGNAYTRTSQVNAVADHLIDGRSHWLQAGFYSGIAFEAQPTLKAENIKAGITIYGVTGTYAPSIEIDSLLKCSDLTSAQAVLDRYSNGEIEASFDGTFSNWESLNIYDYSTHPVGAAYTNPSSGYIAGIQYDDGNTSTANRCILFTTPVNMSAHSILKYKYYVSTWINPTAKLYLISASSLSEAKTKLANSDIAYTFDMPCGNNLNLTNVLEEIENIVSDSYYICYNQPSDPGGNEAILIDLSIIQL